MTPHDWEELRRGGVWTHYVCRRCGCRAAEDREKSPGDLRHWRDGDYGPMPEVPGCDETVVRSVLES